MSASQELEQARSKLDHTTVDFEQRFTEMQGRLTAQIDELEVKLTELDKRRESELSLARDDAERLKAAEIEKLTQQHIEALETQSTERKGYDQSLEARLSEHGGALSDLRESFQKEIEEIHRTAETEAVAKIGDKDALVEELKVAHQAELLRQETEFKTQLESTQQTTEERMSCEQLTAKR